MNNSQVLITGCNGQLGRALVKKYPGSIAVDQSKLDISDLDSIKKFDWSDIKIIINAAAYTDVDGAETPQGRISAWQVNATGISNLAGVANINDLLLVHISTDYVFDGSKSNHTESEPFSPLGVYGQSKAAGDIAVSLANKFFILRTSWVIGDGHNFVKTMLSLAEKGINPRVVADQVGRPTFTSELANAIDFLIKNNSPYGTYNLSNTGPITSWADFARQVFKQSGLGNIKVEETSTKEYFSKKDIFAQRPLDSSFDLTKIGTLGYVPNNWKDHLKVYIEENGL